MNKFLWLTIPSILIFSQAVLATTVDCALQPRLNISRSTNNITAFPYSQNIVDATQYPVTSGGGCRPIAAARFDFRVNSSNTDLEGSKPFGVKSTVNVIGSTANATTLDAAKNWLASNLKLSFRFQSKDDAVDILNQNTAYNIFPSNTANGGTGGITTINGERYSTGNGSSGVTTMSVNLFSLAVQLNVQPSSSIIDALNGKTIEIHAGTLTVKYDNWALGGNPPPTGVTATKTVEVYLNLKLNFRGFPTCTMENQTVNLAQVPTAFLNSNQTANEQSFNVKINCSGAIPGRTVLATITDSYTPANVNNNGILKNQPSLANGSNVDVQLRDAIIPLAIGTQSSFYKVPANSNQTSFIKVLNARYYRSALPATPGYVKTQATVSLDYQ